MRYAILPIVAGPFAGQVRYLGIGASRLDGNYQDVDVLSFDDPTPAQDGQRRLPGPQVGARLLQRRGVIPHQCPRSW